MHGAGTYISIKSTGDPHMTHKCRVILVDRGIYSAGESLARER